MTQKLNVRGMKYYHFLSDLRTVREITYEEYLRTINNPTTLNKRRVVAVGKHWVNFHYGDYYVFVDTRQIAQVMPKEVKE